MALLPTVARLNGALFTTPVNDADIPLGWKFVFMPSIRESADGVFFPVDLGQFHSSQIKSTKALKNAFLLFETEDDAEQFQTCLGRLELEVNPHPGYGDGPSSVRLCVLDVEHVKLAQSLVSEIDGNFGLPKDLPPVPWDESKYHSRMWPVPVPVLRHFVPYPVLPTKHKPWKLRFTFRDATDIAFMDRTRLVVNAFTTDVVDEDGLWRPSSRFAVPAPTLRAQTVRVRKGESWDLEIASDSLMSPEGMRCPRWIFIPEAALCRWRSSLRPSPCTAHSDAWPQLLGQKGKHDEATPLEEACLRLGSEMLFGIRHSVLVPDYLVSAKTGEVWWRFQSPRNTGVARGVSRLVLRFPGEDAAAHELVDIPILFVGWNTVEFVGLGTYLRFV